jgi:dTDP-4-amino-4,6-dideoxygalactose transaminase
MTDPVPAPAAPAVAVPLLDLRAQYRDLEREILTALHDVCALQQFILGPRVAELETRIAAYSQCRFGIGTSSGTDALLAALMALELGPGDEVITTAFSFFATAGAVARVGARPVFCDIDPETYNLAPQAVEDFLRRSCDRRGRWFVHRRTGGLVKALLPVHLFGLMADMDSLLDLAHSAGLAVIEDAAQALGAEDRRGRRAGSLGAVGCFSFFPSKNLGAYGDAGMCVTNDPALADRLRLLRVHGSRPKYHHPLLGGNFRLDEIQAAVLLVKLPYLDGWTRQRQAHACYYTRALSRLTGHVTPPRLPEVGRHVFNQYVIRVQQRDALRAHLTRAGVGTEIYYPVPLTRQPCFAGLAPDPDSCPEAERASREVLAIPVYPELTPVQRAHVVRSIMEFYERVP